MKKTNIIIGVVLVVLAGLAVWKFTGSSKDTVLTPTPTPSPTPVTTLPSPTPTPVVNNKKYKDGTYSASGNYLSPAGNETVNVSLTLKDDVVTAATFDAKGLSGTSNRMQAEFKAGFGQYVIGKNIDDINLTVVNGSSLTPGGFMDALQQIQGKAQA